MRTTHTTAARAAPSRLVSNTVHEEDTLLAAHRTVSDQGHAAQHRIDEECGTVVGLTGSSHL